MILGWNLPQWFKALDYYRRFHPACAVSEQEIAIMFARSIGSMWRTSAIDAPIFDMIQAHWRIKRNDEPNEIRIIGAK
jgi:hypothetical protein